MKGFYWSIGREDFAETNQRRIQRLIIFLWQLTVNKIKAKLKWKKSFEESERLAAEMLTDFYWV